MSPATIKKLHNPLHYFYLLVVLAVCVHFAFEVSIQLSMFNKQGTLNGLNAQDVSDHVQSRFELIKNINFYGYLLLCFSASVLYARTKRMTAFVVNLIYYFLLLCISYFWVGDGLYIFQKQHHLSQNGFSVFIVPMKLIFANILAMVFIILTKAIVKNGSKKSGNQNNQM